MRFLVLAVLGLLVAGCTPFKLTPSAKTPIVEVSKGAVKVDGDAKAPAKVDTKQTDSIMPIPEGSTFVFNEKLGTLTLTVSKATQMAVNRTETAIQGPVAFDPPKQPTAQEQADAKAGYWLKIGLYAGLAIGGALAIFGLVRGWDMVMYGGMAVAGGSAFGIFLEQHPVLLMVIGIGVALIIAGPTLWHMKLKHLVKNEENGST